MDTEKLYALVTPLGCQIGLFFIVFFYTDLDK